MSTPDAEEPRTIAESAHASLVLIEHGRETPLPLELRNALLALLSDPKIYWSEHDRAAVPDGVEPAVVFRAATLALQPQHTTVPANG